MLKNNNISKIRQKSRTQQMKSKIKTDISQINQSKTILPMSEYTKLKQEIKQVKYPTYAFSQAQKIEVKINDFNNQQVRNKLFRQLSGLNSYRKVRGDGNCFFRALAFSYIVGVTIPSYYNCFQYIDQIKLDCCYPESIPKMFKKFYDHKFLENVLKQSWEEIFSKCMRESNNIKNKALLKLFDENPFLDFIIILYFRAVCLKALYRYNDEFQNFITGGEETSIRTYSEQTEGISIKLCSKILNITILVYEVRKDQIHSYHYDASKIINNQMHPSITLLFFQNHYDILESNSNIEAQRSVLKKKSTFYDEVNQNLIKGVCVQCKVNGYVYEISKLCMKCQEASLASLNQFKKEKNITGQCQQCFRYKENISRSFGICADCVSIQNKAVKMQNCSLCNHLDNLDQQTFLCFPCLQKQKMLMNQMQSSKKVQPSHQRAEQEKNGPFIANSGIRQDGGNYGSFTCKKCQKMFLGGKLVNGFCIQCRN